MMETYTIYPEYDKIKGLSPFWITEQESTCISKTERDDISKFIQETRIKDKDDNICYIFQLLQEERKSFDLNNELTNYDAILDEDLKQVSKYLKIRDKNHNCVISKITFDIKKNNKITQNKTKSTFVKKESIYMQNPVIIAEVLKTILSIYKIGTSAREKIKDIIINLKSINKQTNRRRKLAHNLFNYLKHSGIGENSKYYSIGFLFQLSGLENGLSESDYYGIKSRPHMQPYKSYSDFVARIIKNKYFKSNRKIPATS